MSRAGSVKRDSSGRWYFILDLAPPGAPRRQVRRRGFATKAAALAELHEVREQVRSGAYVEPSRSTFGQYLTAWVDGLSVAGRRASTVAGYRDTLRRYVLSRPVADVPLQALTPVELDKLYAELATSGRAAKKGKPGGGLSLRTVRLVHSIIGKALGDAERKGLVPRNVAKLADPPRTAATRAPEFTVWTPAELRAFLDHVEQLGHHHRVLWHVAAFTGLRRGELCGLRWSDVDLDAGHVQVRQTLTAVRRRKVDGGGVELVRGEPKTARGRRTVELDERTVAVLRSHRRAQLEERMLMGAGYADHGAVFAMPDGRPWHPEVVSRAFARTVAAAPPPTIRFHDLRHTHATHLLAAGVNPRIVSERLGHSTVAFTLDTYAHAMPGQHADAAAAVAALVSGDR